MSPCISDVMIYSLMKKSQSVVEEEKQPKHNNRNNEGKSGKSRFGAKQYAKHKNRTTVEESNSNYYKHKQNNSGNGDNLIP